MSTTSQKHRDFIGEPMGQKSVRDIAGIGPVLGKRFEDKGYDKAYVILGQFLVLKMDQDFFIDWFKTEAGGTKKHAMDAFTCLNEWCSAFL